jgi:hypothetical protein
LIGSCGGRIGQANIDQIIIFEELLIEKIGDLQNLTAILIEVIKISGIALGWLQRIQ